MGERTVRFSPNGGEQLRRRLPALPGDRARARLDQGGLADDADDAGRPPAEEPVLARLAARRAAAAAEAPVASEPILRRLSESELAIVEAADHFNASQFRRTVGGIAKSLGTPAGLDHAALGRQPEIVITVAWEISWYQYRVTPDSSQPVRLAERGHDPAELDATFTEWNAHMVEDGRIVPDIARRLAAVAVVD